VATSATWAARDAVSEAELSLIKRASAIEVELNSCRLSRESIDLDLFMGRLGRAGCAWGTPPADNVKDLPARRAAALAEAPIVARSNADVRFDIGLW
jgi:hypothetical protein